MLLTQHKHQQGRCWCLYFLESHSSINFYHFKNYVKVFTADNKCLHEGKLFLPLKGTFIFLFQAKKMTLLLRDKNAKSQKSYLLECSMLGLWLIYITLQWKNVGQYVHLCVQLLEQLMKLVTEQNTVTESILTVWLGRILLI